MGPCLFARIIATNLYHECFVGFVFGKAHIHYQCHRRTRSTLLVMRSLPKKNFVLRCIRFLCFENNFINKFKLRLPSIELSFLEIAITLQCGDVRKKLLILLGF
ncbi:unnamed protein product [Albugo candida]|uniref:Uncharacterized protein n=1 Tax=Albugo candida TaxID=65357 RepID=A0A024FWN5_9STRA|nr:unnamed protein product [Albugo candida]|eukprot:CCI11505.1 unnamed protein product [Albugo candida]